MEVQVLSWAQERKGRTLTGAAFSLYTRFACILSPCYIPETGDGGTTKTFGCDQQRISKSSELPEALGTLDELNSYIGLAKVKAQTLEDPSVPLGKRSRAMSSILADVQENLFTVQAEVQARRNA